MKELRHLHLYTKRRMSSLTDWFGRVSIEDYGFILVNNVC